MARRADEDYFFRLTRPLVQYNYRRCEPGDLYGVHSPLVVVDALVSMLAVSQAANAVLPML